MTMIQIAQNNYKHRHLAVLNLQFLIMDQL